MIKNGYYKAFLTQGTIRITPNISLTVLQPL